MTKRRAPSRPAADARLRIRVARRSDFDRVAAITLAAYRPRPGSSYRATLADAASRTRGATLLVAELDGALVGTATLVLDDGPWSQLRGPDEAELRLLAVDPAAQRRGVGAALVRACLDRAAAAGRRQLVLVTDQSMLAAQRLYEGLGFVRAPERDWSPVAGVDLIAYVRSLPDVASGAGTGAPAGGVSRAAGG